MRWKMCYAAIVLVGILSFCILPASCSSIVTNNVLQSLSATNEVTPLTDGDAERIETLTNLISMYSEQLEEYDRSNGSFVVACAGLAGAVLGIAVNLTKTKKGEDGEDTLSRPNYGVATLFALIPGIATLCLYVFSMQCRRVVLFRGYLTYLENELSELVGVPMAFNKRVVGKFFGEFMTMNAGFGVMTIAVVLMLLVSSGLCLHLALPEKSIGQWKNKEFWKKNWVILLFLIALIVFWVSCAIFVFDLLHNGDIPGKVCKYIYCQTGVNSAPDCWCGLEP